MHRARSLWVVWDGSMPRFTRILTNRDEIERNWDVGTILWPTMRRDDKAYFQRSFRWLQFQATWVPLRVSRILFVFWLKGQFLGISRNLLFLGDLQKKISGIVGYFRANCIAWMWGEGWWEKPMNSCHTNANCVNCLFGRRVQIDGILLYLEMSRWQKLQNCRSQRTVNGQK